MWIQKEIQSNCDEVSDIFHKWIVSVKFVSAVLLFLFRFLESIYHLTPITLPSMIYPVHKYYERTGQILKTKKGQQISDKSQGLYLILF